MHRTVRGKSRESLLICIICTHSTEVFHNDSINTCCVINNGHPVWHSNNNNTQDNVYSAVIMTKSFREFTWFI